MKTSMFLPTVIVFAFLLNSLCERKQAWGASCPTPGYAVKGMFDAGSNSISVAVGDFNADGKLDLAVANQLSTNLSVLLGRGDGTFHAATNYLTGLFPNSVAVGDFNGDSKPDLVVANATDPGSVSVLLGNGNGTFQTAVNFNTGIDPTFVAVGYINGDTNLDLVTANYNDPGTVSVLLGNGNGTFQPAVDYSAGRYPASVAMGDFNGDGKTDLVVGNDVLTGSVQVLLGNGDGTFQTAVSYPTSRNSGSVAIGDFNGDNRPDLVAANNRNPGGSVSVLLGNTNGTFQSAINYATGPNPVSVVVGDFNGDSLKDVAVTDDNGVSVLLGQGGGAFGAPVSYEAGFGAYSLAAGDFNGDGLLDFAVVNYNGNGTVTMLLRTIDLTIMRSDNTHAIVSWPYPSTGFLFESTTSLSLPNWQPATQVPAANGCRWEATLLLDLPQCYFRLRKP